MAKPGRCWSQNTTSRPATGIEDELQPVAALRPEQEDRSRERVLAQHGLHIGDKPVMLAAEVHGLGGDDDPHSVRREDHDDAAFSAETISASRSAGTAASRRTVT